LDSIDVKPLARELVPLPLERLLTRSKDGHLRRPLDDLLLQILDEGDEGDCLSRRAALDRVVLEVATSPEKSGMDVSHGGAELDTVPAEDVALPGVVLGIHLTLNGGVVDDADSKGALGVGVVESRSSLLDLGEELSPIGKGVAETLQEEMSPGVS
jgi:hypothetical protein